MDILQGSGFRVLTLNDGKLTGKPNGQLRRNHGKLTGKPIGQLRRNQVYARGCDLGLHFAAIPSALQATQGILLRCLGDEGVSNTSGQLTWQIANKSFAGSRRG